MRAIILAAMMTWIGFTAVDIVQNAATARTINIETAINAATK
jgi:hypothetical protein